MELFFVLFVGFVSLGVFAGRFSGFFVLFGFFPLQLEVPVLSSPHPQPLSSLHVNF